MSETKPEISSEETVNKSESERFGRMQAQFDEVLDELRRRERLELEKDALARKAIDLVNGNPRSIPKKAQLQNLRTVVAGTMSIEELRIYLHYQMSRRPAPIDERFGNALLVALPEEIEAVRLFVGYVCRYGVKYAER